MNDTIKEIISQRQSTRNFSDQAVDTEKLVEICQLSCLAPSSCNSQPWRLHIVKAPSPKVPKITEACQTVGLNKFLNNVGSYIVVEQTFGNMKSKSGGFFAGNDLTPIDIGILAAHICLVAQSLGLGTCMIGSFRRKTIRKALGFGPLRRVRLVIAVGYPSPDDKLRDKKRKDFGETITVTEE
ncbi:MAG: nitroreductase family protein [Bacteroidales bacterium]|nr:nitroreductase family protein [Bacteroidales bacterium]